MAAIARINSPGFEKALPLLFQILGIKNHA
jgi:hypothetical protein